MFTQPDHTYREIQERSFQQWLNEMEHHSDLAVSGGVRLAREYVQYLKEEIKRQEASNQLKADYMKKLKNEIKEKEGRTDLCQSDGSLPQRIHLSEICSP